MLYIREIMEMENGNPAEKIIVVARNYPIFQSWCDIYGVSHQAPNVIFARNISHTAGISSAWLVDLGCDNPQLNAWIARMLKAGVYKHLSDAPLRLNEENPPCGESTESSS